LPQVLAGAAKRKAALAATRASKQIIIPGTDHFFLATRMTWRKR